MRFQCSPGRRGNPRRGSHGFQMPWLEGDTCFLSLIAHWPEQSHGPTWLQWSRDVQSFREPRRRGELEMCVPLETLQPVSCWKWGCKIMGIRAPVSSRRSLNWSYGRADLMKKQRRAENKNGQEGQKEAKGRRLLADAESRCLGLG